MQLENAFTGGCLTTGNVPKERSTLPKEATSNLQHKDTKMIEIAISPAPISHIDFFGDVHPYTFSTITRSSWVQRSNLSVFRRGNVAIARLLAYSDLLGPTCVMSP
jgi:hypothetical protein